MKKWIFRLARKKMKRISDEEIERALLPGLKLLRTQHYLNWLFRGLAAGLVMAVVFLLVSYVRPWVEVMYWCTGAVMGAGLAALLIAWLLRPTVWEAACAVDGKGLKERVTTALELSGVETMISGEQQVELSENVSRDRPLPLEMIRMQRRDTLYSLQTFDFSASFKPCWPVKESRVLLSALLLGVMLVVLPNPMQAEVDRQVAVKQEIMEQEKKVEEARKKLEQGGQQAAGAPEREITDSLQELQKNLQTAGNQREALKALGQAEEKLAAIGGRGDIREALEATERLSAWLEKQAITRPLAREMAARDAAGVKREMQKLADSLSGLSEQERQSLAASLQGASSDVGDAGLGTELRQAACALNGT